jgi:hypothetical protein
MYFVSGYLQQIVKSNVGDHFAREPSPPPNKQMAEDNLRLGD